MTSLLRAYMDESGSHDGSPVLSIAGYVMRKPQASRFTRQWAATLDEANEGKPKRARYFHMKDAREDGPKGEFKGWDYHPDVHALKLELIRQIRQRTLIGFSVAFNEPDYNRLLAGRGGMPSAYAFGCFAILGMIRRWIERENITKRVAYIFENGHDDATNAEKFVGEMFESARLKDQFNHYSHTWMGKLDAPPLQCADMLAWHTVKEYVSLTDGSNRPLRKDFGALIRPDLDLHRKYNIEHLEQLLNGILEKGIPDDPIPYVPRASRKQKREAPQEPAQ